MTRDQLPSMELAGWRTTRDTIRAYAQVLGKIRRDLTPPQPHWRHITLRVAPTGPTTTPMPAGSRTVEMLLDLADHELVVADEAGAHHQPLHGQSAAALCDEALHTLAGMGIEPEIERSTFSDAPGTYDPEAAERFQKGLSWIDTVFQRFREELPGDAGPVQLWPHHFDLAVLWFSGRLVPGVDPADEESAEESMNFGFSTGDESVPDAYFYITAYPQPDGLSTAPLPADAVWNTTGFQGAVLRYQSVATADDPEQKLMEFLRTVHRAGAGLMKP